MDKDQLKRHIHKSDLTAMEKRYLEGLVDGTRWIPCSERMPESGLTVHVFAVGENFECQFDAYVANSGTWYTFDSSCTEDDRYYSVSHYLKITHWMPLEEPPELVST